MELVSCPNCLAVFGSVQDRCPHCGADLDGEGARVDFDGTTRRAIGALGGLYGGILRASDAYVLWCKNGVCMFDDSAGLLWEVRLGPVDDVRVESARIVARVRGTEVELHPEEGRVER